MLDSSHSTETSQLWQAHVPVQGVRNLSCMSMCCCMAGRPHLLRASTSMLAKLAMTSVRATWLLFKQYSCTAACCWELAACSTA